ncbi:MAG: EamA family transporter, partial [Frankia sp.]|nr:EamA family transporter [Frankia sp.]
MGPGLAPGTNKTLVALCLAVVWVLWGSVYLAIRVVVDEAAPFQAMAQRFLAAGLILSAVVVARRGPRALRVTRSQYASLLVTGVLLLGLGNGLQALAQVKGLPSGVTALVVAAVPAWAVLLRLLLGERPAGLTMVGVGLGFVGLVLLVLLGRGLGGTMPVVGVLLCLGASLSWTVGSYLQGVVDLPDDVFVIAAYQQLVAFLCSAVLAMASGERVSFSYSARGWFALGYLVLACSIVAFLAFAWLLTHVPLSLTATHAYVNPVVAVLLGWVFLSEPIGTPVLVGGGLVLGSVALVVSAERRPAPLAEQTSTQSEA